MDDQRFKLIVDSIKDYSIFMLSPTGIIQTWNRGAELTKGYTASEAIGSHFSRFYTAEDLDKDHPAWELKQAAEKGVYEEEGWRVRKDGTRYWASVVITRVNDRGGKLVGFAKVARDLTEKMLRNKSLIENERDNFRNLFRQTPEMACILSGPEHVFEFVNEAHIRVLGFDATGMAVRVAQPESVEVHGILDRVYQTGVTAELHEIAVTLKDRIRYFNLTYAARRSAEGVISGIMILGVEVTDQINARNALKNALQARDEFLSIASHELKTPITSLKLQLQMAKRGIKIDTNVDRSIKQIDRLTLLVEDLLDVSRIQAGKLSFNMERVDLVQFVGEIVERFADQFSSVGCEVKLKAPASIFINCDRSRMDQVLVNLFTNATKYAPGKPIEVTLEDETARALIRVKDHGPGIPSDRHEKVFERFERAVDSRNISGLGLGLYITKQIVEAHGGQIFVDSDVGKGAAFTVELPK